MEIGNRYKLCKDVEVITCTFTLTCVKISRVHQYWYHRIWYPLGWLFNHTHVSITLIGTWGWTRVTTCTTLVRANEEGEPATTQYMIFSVTYYFELHNVIIVCRASCFCTSHGWIGCLDTVEHWHLYLVKRYRNL
jgi:hypothetical protein